MGDNFGQSLIRSIQPDPGPTPFAEVVHGKKGVKAIGQALLDKKIWQVRMTAPKVALRIK